MLNLPLDPHQKTTVEYAIQNPYSILALEMGLGKTACALAVHAQVKGNLLIICPASLIYNWRDEILKWRGDDPIITLFKKGSELYPVWDSDIVIVSYALVQKAPYLFDWATMVVLDEAHEIKSMKSKKSLFLHTQIFENSTPRVHLLTGTPIKNRVEEYYSLISLMNYWPGYCGESKFLDQYQNSVVFADHFSFQRTYILEVGNKRVPITKWTGIRNEDELKEYIKPHYIRFKSEDVLNLSPIRFKDILISENNDQTLLKEFFQHFKDGEASQITSTYKAEAALKKVPFTINYVKMLLEEIDSVVIYTDHVESCKALAQAFGTKPITGQMVAHERHTLAMRFQEGLDRVIVATVKSFSTGVNLTRSSHMVLNDYPWVPGDLNQTIYRIQRRTQTKSCTVHRIVGSPQDKTILKILEDKAKTIEKVV